MYQSTDNKEMLQKRASRKAYDRTSRKKGGTGGRAAVAPALLHTLSLDHPPLISLPSSPHCPSFPLFAPRSLTSSSSSDFS